MSYEEEPCLRILFNPGAVDVCPRLVGAQVFDFSDAEAGGGRTGWLYGEVLFGGFLACLGGQQSFCERIVSVAERLQEGGYGRVRRGKLMPRRMD